MTSATELHRQAMDLADAAFRHRIKGDHSAAKDCFRKAMEIEARAASLVEASFDNEPTRSILHRSAATLAIHCEDWKQAERLAAAALRGEPPEEIADELRDILELVHAKRHLALRGVVLAPNELQVSVSGHEVAPGFAPTREVVRRVDATERILIRRAEHQLARKYRTRGQPSSKVKGAVETFISPPRAASFAVTIRLGSNQLDLFEEPGSAGQVVRDTIECLDLVAKRDAQALRERIEDDDYLQNFLALAHQIEPDGERIRQVSFTMVDSGQERSVTLARRGRDDPTRSFVDSFSPELPSNHELVGHLRFADSTKAQKHAVKLVTAEGASKKIVVPSEMIMADIVRPLWELRVKIRARKEGRALILQTIDPEPEAADTESKPE
jgi:hypothetical protein